MIIYQGIQMVYAHVVQLINSVATWFRDIPWSQFTEMYPLQFQPIISVMIVIVLSMATVGLVKKLSFLLG